MAEGWDAGWRASADGRTLEVERGEGSMIEVNVAEGARDLELRYRPAGFALGAALSLCAWLILAWGLWRA